MAGDAAGPGFALWPWVKLLAIVAVLAAAAFLALWGIETLSDHTTFFPERP